MITKEKNRTKIICAVVTAISAIVSQVEALFNFIMCRTYPNSKWKCHSNFRGNQQLSIHRH